MSKHDTKERVARTSRGDDLGMPMRIDAPRCPFCDEPATLTGECLANCNASRKARVVREG